MLTWWPCSQWALRKFFWAVALACCCLHATVAEDPSTAMKNGPDDILQTDADLPKRDWNKNLKMWGKRGWNNLHGGWGLKRSTSAWEETNYPPIQEDKKAWSSLQGGWGKRYVPSDDELSLLASLLEDRNNMDNDLDYDRQTDYDSHDFEKRNWNKFRDGWGKRDKWERFRGSWGKREPAWSNLRGVWGK